MPNNQYNQRIFSPYEKSNLNQDTVLRFETEESFLSKSKRWPDLLEIKRLLIIGEAGTGKSHELKQQAEELVKKNQYAFFATLTDIANQHQFTDAVTIELTAGFETWVKSNQPGYFFIDSIDEAVTNVAGVQVALKKIAKQLAPALDRAHIILTTRPDVLANHVNNEQLSQLFNVTQTSTNTITADEALFSPYIDPPSNNDSPPSYTFEEYTLRSLTKQHAREIAAQENQIDAEALFNYIQQSRAEQLACRPIDLIPLARFWRDNQQQTLSQYKLHLALALQRATEHETSSRPLKSLSPKECQDLIARAAAALTLCRKQNLCLNGNPSGNAISMHQLFPDLNDAQRRELSGLGIFVPAANYEIKIMHQTAQEILTAHWLSTLTTSANDVLVPLRIVTAIQYDITVVKPSLRAAASWLSQQNQVFRERILNIAPEVLIETGDAHTLSLSTVETTLNKVFKSLDNGLEVSLTIEQLHKITREHDLSTFIIKRWHAEQESTEVQNTLLRLIWSGAYPNCSYIAVDALKNSQTSYQQKVAIRALISIQDSRALNDAYDFILKHHHTLDKSTLSEAAELIVTVGSHRLDQVATFLINIHPKHRSNFSSEFGYFAEKALDEFPADRSFHLLQSLTNKLQSVEISAVRYGWHLKFCIRLLEISIDGLTLSTETTDLLVRIIESLNTFALAIQNEGGYRLHDKIKEQTRKSQPIERGLFWSSVSPKCTKNPDAKYLSDIRDYYEPWEIHSDSVGWLKNDIEACENPQHQHIILSALLSLSTQFEPAPILKNKVLALVDKNAALQSQAEEWYRPRPKKKWEIESEKQANERRLLDEKADNKTREKWLNFREQLREKCSDHYNDQQLNEIADWLNFSSTHYNVFDWDLFSHAFGQEVAGRAKRSFIQYWKERAKADASTDNLSSRIGIIVDHANSPSWANNLTEQEFEFALSCAAATPHDYEEPLRSLLKASSSATERILTEQYINELNDTQSQQSAPLISWARGQKEPYRSLLAKPLINVLRKHSIAEKHTLASAITLIVGTDQRLDNLAIIAERELAKNTDLNEDHFAQWMRLFFSVDARTASTFLKKKLRNLNPATRAAVFASSIQGLVEYGSLTSGAAYQDYAKPPHISKLVKMAYHYIRRTDDEHQTGLIKETPRWRAQQARSGLLQALLEHPSQAAFDAVLELAVDNGLPGSVSRIKTLAYKKAAEDSETAVISEEQFLHLANGAQLTPTSTEELFDILLQHLCNIADYFQNGRYSNKAILRQSHLHKPKEAPIQIALAAELVAASNNSYSVEREAEEVDHKKPDIDIQAPGFNGQIPIEIKVADNCSYNELRAAVCDQLIGKYLRPNDKTHGILVLSYHGIKSYWRCDEAGNLSPANLATHLEKFASEWTKENGLNKHVGVVLIDLTKIKK